MPTYYIRIQYRMCRPSAFNNYLSVALWHIFIVRQATGTKAPPEITAIWELHLMPTHPAHIGPIYTNLLLTAYVRLYKRR